MSNLRDSVTEESKAITEFTWRSESFAAPLYYYQNPQWSALSNEFSNFVVSAYSYNTM